MGKLSDELVDEPLTQEQLAEVPYPLLSLSEHVAVKGIQAGPTVGPPVAARHCLASCPPSRSSRV